MVGWPHLGVLGLLQLKSDRAKLTTRIQHNIITTVIKLAVKDAFAIIDGGYVAACDRQCTFKNILVISSASKDALSLLLP